MIEMQMVGADVELFLVDASGKPVPNVNITGGTKANPKPIIGIPGYTIQADNAAVEWGIPPAKDIWAFVYSVMRVQEEVTAQVKNYGLAPVVKPSMRFDAKQLQNPQCEMSGCEPDYCAWDQSVNDPVKLDTELRGAGGHVHISFLVDGKTVEYPANITETEMIIKLLDIHIGAMSIYYDDDKDRRKFYGKAGAFRPKPYGLEYRTLSNFWTTDPTLTAWVFNQAQFCVNKANQYLDGPGGGAKLDQYKEYVKYAINKGDKSAAMHLRRAFNIQLPK